MESRRGAFLHLQYEWDNTLDSDMFENTKLRATLSLEKLIMGQIVTMMVTTYVNQDCLQLKQYSLMNTYHGRPGIGEHTDNTGWDSISIIKAINH